MLLLSPAPNLLQAASTKVPVLVLALLLLLLLLLQVGTLSPPQPLLHPIEEPAATAKAIAE